MSTNQFSMYSATFGHGSGSTLDLRQLRSQGLQLGSSRTSVRPGGSLDPGANYLGVSNPRQTFVSRDLLTILTTVSISAGLFCTGGSTMRFQKREQGGAFASGSDHTTVVTTKGWLGIESFSVDADSVEGMDLNLTYVPLFDGSNAIVVQTDSVSFSAVATPLANSVYYLGPCYLNGSLLAGLTNVSVRPAINFMTKRTDGDVAPQNGAIFSRDPMIDLTFSDITKGTTLSLFGQALSGNLDLYFLRGGVGARLPTASGTNHARVRAAAGVIGAEGFQVSGEENGNVTFSAPVIGPLASSVAVNLP